MLFMSHVSYAFVSIHCCLMVTCWELLTSWLLFVMFNCGYATFPCGILGQVWYLIVLIPDFCRLTFIHLNSFPGIFEDPKETFVPRRRRLLST